MISFLQKKLNSLRHILIISNSLYKTIPVAPSYIAINKKVNNGLNFYITKKKQKASS